MGFLTLNEDNFLKETSNGLVLVDFWAEWCGPCRTMLEILDSFAGEYSDKIKIAKINVDDNQALAQKFRVMSIPTILILKDGKLLDQFVGLKPFDELKKEVDKYL